MPSHGPHYSLPFPVRFSKYGPWITIREYDREWSIPLPWVTRRLGDGSAVLVEQVRQAAGAHGVSLDAVHAALNAWEVRR